MRKYLGIFYIIISILFLPLLLLLARTAQIYLSRAGGIKANISVDTQSQIGDLPHPWIALAQGLEGNPPILRNVTGDIKNLSPSYIRIDHIYDQYSVVEKSRGQLIFDFSKLDDTVSDIISSGALPFFSLSYMPQAISSDGNPTSKPNSWNDWEKVVLATIEHYSGKNNKNLSNVYYEVWNEPDFFGNWNFSADKDYRLLYMHSVVGANLAQNVNSFYIGGPALTNLNKNWINNFITYVSNNNLRLDFLSWHRYSDNASVFGKDGDDARKILENYGKYANIPLFITEWGINSENDPAYDNKISASFTIASIKEMLGKIGLAFTFEIKEGSSADGNAYWGRWGLITSEKGGLVKKPRYYALSLVNNMKGKRLSVNGEGSFVKGFSAQDNNTTRVILTNYDRQGINAENVPVTFINLPSASYLLRSTYLNGITKQSEFVVTSGKLTQNFLMNPNDTILVELIPNAKLATFTTGVSGKPPDQALVLNLDNLVIPSPPFVLGSSGSITFFIKPNWNGNDPLDRTIFDAPFSTNGGSNKHLILQKNKIGFSNKLIFGVVDGQKSQIVSSSIDNWNKGTWQKLSLNWNPTQLSISINDQVKSELNGTFNISGGGLLTFNAIDAAIDDLSIMSNGKEIIKRSFDGNIDQ